MPTSRCNICVFSTGIFLVLSGLVLVLTWPIFFDGFWKENLVLKPSSKSYSLWIKTPMPLYLEIYLFNWTNSKEFLQNKNVKPAFEEVGPFVFQEIHDRTNVIWNENQTVTYNQIRTWHYLPEKSVSISTPITNLNVVLLSIAKRASNFGWLVDELINFLMHHYNEKLIIEKPANQWLFDGMSDKLLDFVRQINNTAIPFDKFGWFYGRNKSATFDGVFNVKTGEDNIYDLGLLTKWNNLQKTNFFKNECALIQGTTTELFAPIKNLNSNLSMFISDFCSPIKLVNSGTRLIHGLEGYHYIGDKSVFDNGTQYPNSKCFCTGECSPSGVRNETLCRGAPIFLSFPHFYTADTAYLKSITGLKPNKSIHEFYITIDPLSGLPLDVRAQFQINVLLEPLRYFSFFNDVPKVYIPMMWFRQRINLPDELASTGEQLRVLDNLGFAIGLALISAGCLIIIIRLFILFMKSDYKNYFRTANKRHNFERIDNGEENS